MPLLGSHPRVELGEPLEYREFVQEMNRAHIILTDSGGIQEEAPSLGKPVLVMRETTERPEGIDAAYQEMAQARNPYGDGHATGRILQALEK